MQAFERDQVDRSECRSFWLLSAASFEDAVT
jgi:hypothetical protein